LTNIGAACAIREGKTNNSNSRTNANPATALRVVGLTGEESLFMSNPFLKMIKPAWLDAR
jgi:hypothetical protein